MEITGFFSAILIGIVIGILGRLVLPGRQSISWWLTILIGIVAALIGTVVAGAINVADTGGVDWIELALQVAFAALGVGAAAAVLGNRSRV